MKELVAPRPATNGAVLRIAAPQPVHAPPSASLVEHGPRLLLVVVGVMLAALMQTIDITIVNVSLPTIQGNLGASIDEATWLVTGYVIANIIVIPITPWLQRRFGRKRYFMVSIAGFTVASVLCGMATTLPMLIAFRVIQGAFGGGLMSTAQVIMRDTFPPQALGTSQSIFSMGTVLGPSIGPTLGGMLLDSFSWPWIFMVNIVPGIIALVLLHFYLRDGAQPRREPVDVGGIALLTVSVAALQYVLDQGQLYDWFSDARIDVAAIVAVLGTAAFVWHELTTAAPIVDLRVLRYRGVAVAVLTSFANALGIFGVVLLLPQFMVTQLGYTSTLAGMVLAMRAIPVLLLSVPIGRLANHKNVDLRWLIGGGIALSGVGNVWLAMRVSLSDGFWSFGLPLALCGLGIAFIYSPLLVAALRGAPPSEGPKSAALVILAMQLGGSIASALIVAFVDHRVALHLSTLSGAITLRTQAATAFLHTHSVAQLAHAIGEQAWALSYMDAFWLLGWIAVLFAPAVYFLKARTAGAG